MTQKSGLFKGQKKKGAAANRHGKATHIRKGKQFKAPSKKTEEYDVDKEVTKFVNSANERKAATLALKEGARLRVVKDDSVEANRPNKPSKPSKKKSVPR